MTDLWTDAEQWKEEWVQVRDLGQGGQGTTKLVRRTGADDTGCLKVLSQQKDPERRQRFLREATAYDTFSHPLIPKLVQSNAHHHADLNWRMFLVAEFIPGPTLSEYVEEHGRLGWNDAHSLTSRLLEVVRYLHENDWVHRDIKSDNIILRNSSPSEPVLLDFGLGFKPDVEETLRTPDGQEIGNRFFRLPELAIGSTAKRDARCDLSFVGGVFFYSITGILPVAPLDEEGKMPHQRRPALDLITAAAGAALGPLLDFFDRCFNTLLSRRYADASEMLVALAALEQARDRVSDTTADDDLALIQGHLNRDSLAQITALADNCMGVYRSMDRVVGQVVGELNGRFVRTQGGMQQKGASVHTNLGVAQALDHDVRYSPRWQIDVQGDEIVVRSDDGFTYRLEALNPDTGAAFASDVRTHLLKGVRKLIEKIA
jgi:serine/threonine-protein kinase